MGRGCRRASNPNELQLVPQLLFFGCEFVDSILQALWQVCVLNVPLVLLASTMGSVNQTVTQAEWWFFGSVVLDRVED